MLLSKIMMLLINVSRVWRHALSWWSGKGLGIWNLCSAPLFPQLYRPFACEVKANADMTPKKLRPRPSRRFATAFTRAQWQRKDHRKGAALAMPPDGRGLSPGTSKSRRCGAQRKAAPVPAQRECKWSCHTAGGSQEEGEDAGTGKEGWLGGERESDHKASGRRRKKIWCSTAANQSGLQPLTKRRIDPTCRSSR
jgi:hypothetical protein